MTDAVALAEYVSNVSNSTRSYLASAVTRMAQEQELLANDMLRMSESWAHINWPQVLLIGSMDWMNYLIIEKPLK